MRCERVVAIGLALLVVASLVGATGVGAQESDPGDGTVQETPGPAGTETSDSEVGPVTVGGNEISVSAIEATNVAESSTRKDDKAIAVKFVDENVSKPRYAVVLVDHDGNTTGVVVSAQEEDVLKTVPNAGDLNTTRIDTYFRGDEGKNLSKIRTTISAIEAGQDLIGEENFPLGVAMEAHPGLMAYQVTVLMNESRTIQVRNPENETVNMTLQRGETVQFAVGMFEHEPVLRINDQPLMSNRTASSNRTVAGEPTGVGDALDDPDTFAEGDEFDENDDWIIWRDGGMRADDWWLL
jgi:hypothetical protein